MTFDDWLLALHLLSAFALVGAITIFSIGFVVLRSADTPARVLALGPAMQLGQRAVIVGVAGTIVFGVWLAISLDAYQLWDLWVILALVGWAAATAAGRRSGAAHRRRSSTARSSSPREGKDGPDAELAAMARSLAGRTRCTGSRPRSPCSCSST